MSLLLKILNYEKDLFENFLQKRKQMLDYIQEIEINLISFNWTLTKTTISKKFNLTFGMAKNTGVNEFGIKHTFLGTNQDFYRGEGRIVTLNGKRYCQINFASSSL